MVRCDEVTDGLRDSECLVTIKDFNGRKHFIRVERDFLTEFHGGLYLPMGIVQVHPGTRSVLVEFSHEPETGFNRIWVKKDQLDEPVEAFA